MDHILCYNQNMREQSHWPLISGMGLMLTPTNRLWKSLQHSKETEGDRPDRSLRWRKSCHVYDGSKPSQPINHDWPTSTNKPHWRSPISTWLTCRGWWYYNKAQGGTPLKDEINEFIWGYLGNLTCNNLNYCFNGKKTKTKKTSVAWKKM